MQLVDMSMINDKDYSGNCIGKYLLKSKLGNGYFGSVYKAYDRVLKVDKALKILNVRNVTEVNKLFNEAAIPYKCRHDNIVRIDSGEIIDFMGEFVFVVDMELVDGSSVDDFLRASETSVVWSIEVIKKILFAVEFSHINRNIHRDIKPANILIDKKGTPKLSDFGLATTLGKVVAPPIWYTTHAAPETASNSVATVQTDIYALGMTLFRMVNGISDWQAYLQGIPNFQKAIKEGKLFDILTFSPVVPDKVVRIIRKACNRKPLKRYSSAAEMRNALENLHLRYDWRKVSDEHWRGTAKGLPDKDVYIELVKNCSEVIVKNNNRKSSSDSKSFQMYEDAKSFMYSYVKNNTVD